MRVHHASSQSVRRPRILAIPTVAMAAGLALTALGCATTTRDQAGPFVAPPRTQPAPVAVAGGSPSEPAKVTKSQALPRSVRVRISDNQGTRIVELPVDDYVVGCVRAELLPHSQAPGSDERLLQVQALVSRTYAVANLGRHRDEGFDLCDGTHCQLYRGARGHEHGGDPASLAVAATRDQVITFEGRPILAVFHSNCGGHTTGAEHVWHGDPLPYLRPVPDWFCSRAGRAPWTFTIDEAQLRVALNADEQTSIGKRLDRIDIVERDAAGRATAVRIAGERSPRVGAEEFRGVMRRAFGARSIKSTWFSVTRRANQFQFEGVGFGHGVGLCQTGAALRAQAGQSPTQVVTHYFPGTKIEALPSAVLAGK